MIERMDVTSETRAAPSPTVGWASGPLGAVQAASREIGRQTALRARAVAAFAATRPASDDRPPGTPGAMSADRRASRPEVLAGVSEWAAQELVIAMSITQVAAENLLQRSLTLVHRLPRTLVALESGLIHDGHLWHLLDKVAPIADATIRARVEREVLDWVAGRSVTTPAQLGAKARRSVLRHDAAAAAQRLARALRERGVSVRSDRREGMAVFDALLTVPEAHALLDVLGRYADAIDDPDDTRTRGQKMADCLLDLVLRPGEQDGPPVQARLTLVAGVATLLGGDQPGEIDGEPVPAELVRALARALGLLPEVRPEAPDSSPDPDLWPDEPPAEAWTDAVRAADERWWAAVEERALRGEWRGAEDPPLEVLERWWAEEQHWDESTPSESRPHPRGEPGPDRQQDEVAPSDEPSGEWAAADRAVDRAGEVLLNLQRAVGAAHRAVSAAWRAAADGEDAWEDSAAAGGGLLDRPRIAIVDELTGALLALTDSTELRRHATFGACLGPPPPSDGYRPGAALDRYVRARDRRCRQPGCRRRVPLGGELDHDRPWPDGPTSAGNLAGYCTGHHRGKHQAPGWQHSLAEDGTLTVLTPTGLVATTTPPPF